MRTHVRRIGTATAAALVLVLPLGPSAQAAPTADLSVTKKVASVALPITFDPTMRDVRGTSTDEWTRDGLHIKTLSNGEEDKVGEYAVTNTPLADAGEPSIGYETISGTIPPSFVLKVDVTGDGKSDGELIGEASYYGNVWWLNDPRNNPGDFSAINSASAPVCGVNVACGSTGNGKDGTLDQWRAAFPTATVVGFGFGLGSGVQGEYHVTGLTFAGTHYDFVRRYQPSMTAAPGQTLEYQITVTNDSDADLQATGTTITDTLPNDLTYVPGSLEDFGNGCSFVGKTLTCNAGTFPVGFTTKIYFRAKLSNTITSDGLPKNTGHNVDVQKQEVFADLTANQTKTFNVWCPSGYLATDGGLLVDAVDQGGFYSDLVTLRSRPTTAGGLQGWTVRVRNLDDYRGQGKVKVTCLSARTGTVNGHGHDLVVSAASGVAPATSGVAVQRTCPAGYTPVAPWFDASDLVTVQASYAHLNTWVWIFDFEPGTVIDFGASCLAPETTSSGGHTAPLALTMHDSTIPVAADSRTEGVQQCGQLSHAITGGYGATNPALLSLGKEQRGTNYMFRFYNDDWDSAWNAYLQVQCVGVRTADERTFYTVTNTARVTTTAADRSTSDDTSSAVVKIDGAPVTPPGGVSILAGGTRTESNSKIKFVNVGVVCPEACSFSIKVLKNDVVVAKGSKSLPASTNPKFVAVPTTSAGKNLGTGPVTVKVKTEDGTNTRTVTLS